MTKYHSTPDAAQTELARRRPEQLTGRERIKLSPGRGYYVAITPVATIRRAQAKAPRLPRW